ncbi:nucleoside diphosphate kinase regulator [Sphingobium xenophagum]|uniref:nucleoside diphosphate kinase regulator n=1 Tax=Sphingobium xenophagum TaxID=121428 RepID=UPI001C0DAC84|nr:nucleoside diphosphate kinase regulator [Sphingobium xenophagum]QWT16603.1 nucleoside diphosphate kinase regulator [Sphingobium xenophagum]
MTKTNAAKRPPIHMIDTEADGLADLAMNASDSAPQVSLLLLGEIERATTHERGAIPADVVTMGATVEFIDEATGADRTVELVYPKHADIAASRVSILTPVGAGLIGLREGQSILWPDRSGHERRLRIVKVLQPASAHASDAVGYPS